MNFALFAADSVGNEIAQFFEENNERLSCLVVDSKDRKGINNEIIASGKKINCTNIFSNQTIYGSETIARLKELNLDLIILAWWPYIIKKELISIPKIGCLNFHPSFLPYNRGKHYNFWAIVEDVPFGVTIHWVTEEIDAGDIAFQKRINTSWEDTGETLYYKAQKEIVSLFKDNFFKIKKGDISRIPQNLLEGSFHLSTEIDSASRIELDEKYKARELLNIIRARSFAPHPAAWFIENGKKYEVRINIKEKKEV
jgi:methionyl-tRNA formyltransferase